MVTGYPQAVRSRTINRLLTTLQVVTPAERAARRQVAEARREERRQHEMRLAMAVLMANARKGPYSGYPTSQAQVSPQPQPYHSSYF